MKFKMTTENGTPFWDADDIMLQELRDDIVMVKANMKILVRLRDKAIQEMMEYHDGQNGRRSPFIEAKLVAVSREMKALNALLKRLRRDTRQAGMKNKPTLHLKHRPFNIAAIRSLRKSLPPTAPAKTIETSA